MVKITKSIHLHTLLLSLPLPKLHPGPLPVHFLKLPLLTQSRLWPILHLLLPLVQAQKPAVHRRDPTPSFPRGLPG